jgi:hypothetical protein
MTLSNSDAAGARQDYVLLKALYVSFVFFVLLRIGLNSLILNQFMNYTTVQGSIVEKIHPASYGIALVVAVLLLSFRIELSAADLKVLRAILVFCTGVTLLLAMLVVIGLTTSIGYVLDTYLIACLAAFGLMCFPAVWRPRLCELILALFVLSALVGIAEFATHARLLPYAGGEDTFRPTGLSEHPLQLGQWCAIGICFACIPRWPIVLKLFVVTVLLVGALVSGARVATLCACLSCVAFLIAVPINAPSRQDVLQRKLMLAIAGLVTLAAIVSAMLAAGALSRLTGGLVDQSSQARVGIYRVFDYMTWSEILFGTDIVKVQRIAMDILGLKFIESSPVLFTVQFGLFGAIFFAGLLIYLFSVLLKGRSYIAVFATLMFFGLSLSNNALSTKSADILVLMFLIMSDQSARPRLTRS